MILQPKSFYTIYGTTIQTPLTWAKNLLRDQVTQTPIQSYVEGWGFPAFSGMESPKLLREEVEKKINFLVCDLVDQNIKTSKYIMLLRTMWRRAGEITSSKLSNAKVLSKCNSSAFYG